jgi:hypothetical protein
MRPRETPPDELSTEVRQLLSGVSIHGDWHLGEIEQDLVQMAVLLDEAIRKLCDSFMAIHGTVGQQQEALDDMLSAGGATPDPAARFEALRGEISLHVDTAVTGLQFQDMTSQLIGRMGRHLADLRDVLGALDAHGPALPDAGDDSLPARLTRIGSRVGTRTGAGGSAVSQRHMESGDIELF